ncbi:PREDICTED: angiopoietin-1 receptor-like [Diuraphis noxia]|uniref:angiopoietin-1 receptor-like n=1 Tax=Diuraphis noxia TaxID=143948 RepID=UPI00076391FB|nr:PREDICTED: angiopoietin-1 receptor-like [Diuraphis noxia]
MNCHYKIKYHPNLVSEGLKVRYVDVRESYAAILSGLIPKKNYSVQIQPAGDTVEFKFSTPSCLEVNNFNFNSCPPNEPYDVKLYVTQTAGHTDKSTYNAQVRWKSLNGRGVDYFTIKLNNEAKNVSGKHYITAADASGVTEYVASFDDVPFKDWCLVSVQAYSSLGHSQELVAWLQRDLNETVATDSRHLFYYPSWTTVTLFGLMAFCAALAVGRHLHRRAAAGTDRGSKGGVSADGYDMVMLKGLDDVDVLLDDNAVTVSDVFLGHGHFGVVRKGTLKTADGLVCSVAIKSLRDRPSGRDRDEFLREILLMQKVGKHPNIVSMIGCCLDANRRCMLVVEYCPLGDLQTYLRKVSIKSWYANDFYVGRTDQAELTAAENSIKVVESLQEAVGPPPMVFNNCYLYHGDENVFLTVDDLLCFASQAANGMLFLENNRVVHRDLAARNILLSDHRTIKICDFGLSRDVYEQNLYQKSNRGDPLPVKWMALESLKYQLYTTQSDVWSFGVLLWEIMMLGGTPYPTISSSRIYEVLCRGYRMPRPTLCCYSLYEVMLACWQSNPANRPKFGTIKDTIDGIMENQYT